MNREQCCKKIYTGSWSQTSRSCSRAGTVERDGKFYCKQHDPVRIKEKQEKDRLEREQVWEERRRIKKLEKAAPELLEALKAAERELEDWMSVAKGDDEEKTRMTLVTIKKAIKKAEGE